MNETHQKMHHPSPARDAFAVQHACVAGCQGEASPQVGEGELACCCLEEGGWGLPPFNSAPPCITAGGRGRACLLLLGQGGLGPAFLQECAAMHHLRWAGGELGCCCCLEGGWGLPSFKSVPPCITSGGRGESLPAAAAWRGAGACLPSTVCRHASPQVGGGELGCCC